ncbi:hypothetical protein KCP77_20715 [Salmonella enterica subsp. enterica]|nr:hypothetical protein KCP77_20715 [Salmonella enterica subsp. enterica]
MKGEKGMMEALASVDEFGEQLRLNGWCHHFVSYMMRNPRSCRHSLYHGKAERKAAAPA